MALKKRIPTRPATPTKTTSVATNAVTTSKEVPKRTPIAPPARKRVPAPAVRNPESPASAPAAKPVETPVEPPKATRRAKVTPKEVKPVEQTPKVEQKVERKVSPSPEAPKPTIPAGSHHPEPGPRHTDKPEEKRVSIEAMRAMEPEERYKLFKSLNKDPDKFIPIRNELPKMMQMRKDEALIRELISEKAPKAKGHTIHYCPYCVDWQIFHHHSWIGYNKCIGCSITTKDFYVAVDNGIFGKG